MSTEQPVQIEFEYQPLNLNTEGKSLVEIARLAQGLANTTRTALSVEHEGIDLRLLPGRRWEDAVRDWHQANIDLATDRQAEANREIDSWFKSQNPETQFNLEYPAGTHGVFTWVPYEGSWSWEVEVSSKTRDPETRYYDTMQEAVNEFMAGWAPFREIQRKSVKTGDPCSNCKTPYDMCTDRVLTRGEYGPGEPLTGKGGLPCCGACGHHDTHNERDLVSTSETGSGVAHP